MIRLHSLPLLSCSNSSGGLCSGGGGKEWGGKVQGESTGGKRDPLEGAVGDCAGLKKERLFRCKNKTAYM